MTAMPAEKWPVFEREVREETELDRLIDAVSYFQELVFEYPRTTVYHHMLSAAREKLREAELNLKKERSRH